MNLCAILPATYTSNTVFLMYHKRTAGMHRVLFRNMLTVANNSLNYIAMIKHSSFFHMTEDLFLVDQIY